MWKGKDMSFESIFWNYVRYSVYNYILRGKHINSHLNGEKKKSKIVLLHKYSSRGGQDLSDRGAKLPDRRGQQPEVPLAQPLYASNDTTKLS